MPIQYPHHVSSLFRISRLEFRISPDPSGRIMQNEPNSPRPTAQKCKTNPISAAADLWKTKKWKTNPICERFMQNEPNLHRSRPVEAQKEQNEPNFHRGGPVEDQKMRNEPNLRRGGQNTND